MKKILHIAAIGAVALSINSVAAETFPRAHHSTSHTLNVLEVHGSALHTARAARAAFQSVRGVYAMDDGSSLWLYQNGGKFVAEVGGQAPVEVVARANGKFVAVDGKTEFRFVQNAAGLVENVVLSKTA